LTTIDEEGTNGRNVPSRARLLFVLGFFTITIGLVLVLIATALSGGTSLSFGGFIIIGPFPIVFGSGPNASLLILLGVIITVLSVITFLIMRRRVRRQEPEP